MNNFSPRTDLADESRQLATVAQAAKDIEGVDYNQTIILNLSCQELIVRTQAGATAIGKPVGTYYTLDIGPLLRREDKAFDAAASALSQLISKLIGDFSLDSPILIVGLGNRDITPDAIGPHAAASTLVTRHLKEKMAEDFKAFSPVCVITPGVLGTSGIESFDYIKAVCDLVKPSLVIAVDALAARGLERLCSTIQITDTGISPGSGVGNTRPEISKATLGISVLAIGVPTIVDLRTVCSDLLKSEPGSNNASSITSAESMIVTPRSIDTLVTSAARAVAYGVNLALHPGLTIQDVDMLLC